jgi:hypothetical protein
MQIDRIDPNFSAYKKLTSQQRHTQIESEKMGKLLQANGNQKERGVAIFILDKIDYKPKLVRIKKEGDYILTKGKSLPRTYNSRGAE